MAKTEVILTHNIVGLGGESDQVKVSAGYARNYLLPQGFAIPVTAANKRRLEALKERRAKRETHDLNAMTELARGFTKLICLLKVKTGDDGKMFGAVTTGMIADELKHQFDIALDKKKIRLEQPIKELGEHDVELHLHADIKASLKVRVESLTPITVPVVEAKSEGYRTEKRGRRSSATDAPADAGAKQEAKPRAAKTEKAGKTPAK